MNASMSTVIKRTMFSLGLGIALVPAGPGDVSAHTIEIRPGIVQVHYVRGRDVIFPRWLRRDRAFRHWYWHSHYRLQRRLAWRRLYDIYRLEHRYRWRNRRLHRQQFLHHRR